LVYEGRETDRQSDGQADMTKLTIDFRNVVNTSKNWGTVQLLSAITICQENRTSKEEYYIFHL